MRKLVWVTIGVAVGIGCGIYILEGSSLLAAALGMAAAALVLMLMGREYPRCVLAGCVALGCFLGIGCLQLHDAWRLQPLRAYDGTQAASVIELTEYSRPTDYGTQGSGKIVLGDKRYRVDFYLNAQESLKPGDRIRGTFALSFTGPGGAGQDLYRQGEGTFLMAYPRGTPEILPADLIPVKYFPVQLRQSLKAILRESFSSDTWGFAAALLLGDSEGLSTADDTALTTSGLHHVIAVSGMHVAFLFSVLFLFFGKHRVLMPLVGFPVLIVFALLTGCTPSILRACAMQGLMLLSLLLDREYDPPTALAFSVLVILGVNPLAFGSVSFQLSVCCVMGIFLFSPRLQNWFVRKLSLKGTSIQSGFLRMLTQSVSVTLGATVLVTPLCALHFGTVSLVGLLANLLTLWVISFLFDGIMLVCVLGYVWPAMASALAWVLAFPMRYVLLVANVLARVPFAALSVSDPYIALWLLFAYALFGIFLLLSPKRPVLFAGCVAVSLLWSMLLSSLEYRQEDFRMTVLDVGQGQCILLQAGEETYVVDCGGNREAAADLAAQRLRSCGVTKIDGLILTHYDRDHAGDAKALLAQFPVERLYMPHIGSGGYEIDQSFDGPVTWVDTPVDLPWNAGTCRIFPSDREDSCMCILFQLEKCDILITGDRDMAGEWDLIRRAGLAQVDILVVGHHGARTSTGNMLLETLRPKEAVISVGEDNGYGHPHKETLIRLKRMGVRIWRTDLQGTIVIRG